MIESLQSPHVVRVKALLSSKKDRIAESRFVAEGLQSVREALVNPENIETLYLTQSGAERLERAGVALTAVKVIDISEKIVAAMSDAITSQGIIAICKMPNHANSELSRFTNKHVIFLNEIQDPGNAGTILRSADAMGISAVITSPGSVDFYSPKVVRSTAGSLWHLPVFSNLEIAEVIRELPAHRIYLLDGASPTDITTVASTEPAIWIFGNEARGLPDLEKEFAGAARISIKMPGNAESLNLAAAASIVMYQISRGK